MISLELLYPPRFRRLDSADDKASLRTNNMEITALLTLIITLSVGTAERVRARVEADRAITLRRNQSVLTKAESLSLSRLLNQLGKHSLLRVRARSLRPDTKERQRSRYSGDEGMLTGWDVAQSDTGHDQAEDNLQNRTGHQNVAVRGTGSRIFDVLKILGLNLVILLMLVLIALFYCHRTQLFRRNI